jgi:glycosyltransferase involved in cell wall biosynthesis
MTDITVAIPTYNGENRIPMMLEKLRQQTNIEQISWEVLIVDNNSKDNTSKVIQEYQTNWNKNIPLRYSFEPEQGAAFARLRAVKEAKGELVAFLDDDNLPANDWLEQAYIFAQKYPQAGAFSGQIHGDFAAKPPENFTRIQAFLAIREHGSTPHKFEPEKLRLPPGAALVVRRQAWCESVPSRPKLTGKLPGLMIQGDDYEPLLYLHKAGWEIWYHPGLHSYHQIPDWRLEKDYLCSICRGCGLATCELLMINAENWQKPALMVRTVVGSLRRIVMHLIKYKGKVQTDAIAASELDFYWGSLLSPFYSIQRSLITKKPEQINEFTSK